MSVDDHVSTLTEEQVHPRLAVLSVSTLLVYLDFLADLSVPARAHESGSVG